MVRAPVVCGNCASDRAMRTQILSVLEELCRDMTLRDVREWYVDSMNEPGIAAMPGASGIE